MSILFVSYDINNSFILNELKYYAKNGVKVLVITKSEDIPDSLLSEYIDINKLNDKSISAVTISVKKWMLFFCIVCKEVLVNIGNPKYLLNIKAPLLQALHELKTAVYLSEKTKQFKISHYYSYWFYDEALMLSWLCRIGFAKAFISRAHAFDIYEEHRKHGLIPFRSFVFRQVKSVFAVSEDGKAYLCKKHNPFREKIKTHKLGIENQSQIDFTPPTHLKIISCGAVQRRKRTKLIHELVKDIPGVEWTHIGDGPQMNEYFGKIDFKEKPGIKILGGMSNEEVLNNYRNNQYSLFISLSENEGIPVSIMEAISFGIPVIATDVGGCREIVTPETGLLIPVYFNLQQLKLTITQFMNSQMNTAEFREGVHLFWSQNFNADINYRRFLKEALS
jgi:glycosyltransferase involved in cell wall biosynthesis